MKHISDLTGSISQTQSSDPLIDTFADKDKQTIKELFVLMKANYGNKFTSHFTGQTDVQLMTRIWLVELAGIHRDLLLRAMQLCFEQLEWPPTLAEYLDRLRYVQNNHATETMLALPHRPAPARDSSVAQRELRRMRKILS